MSAELAKQLAVASDLLDEWRSQPAVVGGSGVACGDFPPNAGAALRYAIDRVYARAADVVVEGWAFDPERGNPPHSLHAVFVRAPAGGWLAFAAMTVIRSDLASVFGPIPRIDRSGFCAAISRRSLPSKSIEFMIVQQNELGLWGRTEALRWDRPDWLD
ncbi:MAG TPA: hypothetical protein VGL42_16870 [Opitutaceae bacterium]|jgi:hypothetical protein